MYEDLKKRIIRKLGAERSGLNRSEERYVVSWKEEYKLKDDIIIEGFSRAVNMRGQNISFAYIDKILKSWSEHGVSKYSDILALDEEYRRSRNKDKDFKSVNKKSSKVKIKLLSEAAHIPTYGSSGAAGADLYADLEESIFIDFGKTAMISTGIAVQIPEGYVGLLCARSGLASKHGIAPANKVGVIDSDYTGPVTMAALNSQPFDESKETWDEYVERHTIKPGDRIGQLIITPYFIADFEVCEDLDKTERGSGGFGSTGK